MSCYFQEIHGNRQLHPGETADLESGYAEQDFWRESLAEEFQAVQFPILSTGQHKDRIGAAQRIRAG